jgi:hypothetical protein
MISHISSMLAANTVGLNPLAPSDCLIATA